MGQSGWGESCGRAETQFTFHFGENPRSVRACACVRVIYLFCPRSPHSSPVSGLAPPFFCLYFIPGRNKVSTGFVLRGSLRTIIGVGYHESRNRFYPGLTIMTCCSNIEEAMPKAVLMLIEKVSVRTILSQSKSRSPACWFAPQFDCFI